MSEYVGSNDPATLLQEAINAANTYGVPQDLFTAIIQGESSFNPSEVSSTGAIGLGQVLPSTAVAPGYGVPSLANNTTDAAIALQNPQTNLNFAAAYLSGLYNYFGSWIAAVTHYNDPPAGQLPYAGNNQQQNILNAATAADAGNEQAATGQSSGSTTSGILGGLVFGGLVSGLFALATQFSIVLLGIVVIGLGIFMLSKGSHT